MKNLTELEQEFYNWLIENVEDECCKTLLEFYGKAHATVAFNAWINDIDSDGHIEISGINSKTKNPICGNFKALYDETWSEITK